MTINFFFKILVFFLNYIKVVWQKAGDGILTFENSLSLRVAFQIILQINVSNKNCRVRNSPAIPNFKKLFCVLCKISAQRNDKLLSQVKLLWSAFRKTICIKNMCNFTKKQMYIKTDLHGYIFSDGSPSLLY